MADFTIRFNRFFSVVLAFVTALFSAPLFVFPVYKPVLIVDFSETEREISNGASGYLYGIAEEGVPSKNMTESVDISTVVQKAPEGLQHPIGDILHVESHLENTDYNIVYLQDDYDTWYYNHANINEMRKAGTYDWEKFVREDYLPRVRRSVATLSEKPYSEKTVYCLYNETDNGVWFGTTVVNDDGNVWGNYDEAGRQNFYKGWKITYDEVKSINPNALIGGPGFYEYSHWKIEEFLSYCKENNCLPDVMIYHELADNSIYNWQSNVNDYREIEKSLSIDELPIIVSEYGRMQDNGMPGKMLQYITQIELSGVYGDNAYWRLANNLCDVAADDNSPNSNWWVYRWYADMSGELAKTEYIDIFKSNVGKALLGERDYTSQGFMGLASKTDEKIDIICGGTDGDARVKIKGLEDSSFDGKEVLVSIEGVFYKGLSGVVNAPEKIMQYKAKIRNGSLTIEMPELQQENAYHITVTEYNGEEEYDNSDNLPVRFEAEHGTLLGDAYTYDSAYATTGEISGMVGGMEKSGDGVRIKITVPENGEYDLSFIYGKSNDGRTKEDRVSAKVNFSLDGKTEVISFANTIKSEYTDFYSYVAYLEKGEHILEFTNNQGTYVLDSILVEKYEEETEISLIPDEDRTTSSVTSFLAVAPYDGYYEMETDADSFLVNDKEAEKGNYVYLMRGLNFIDLNGKNKTLKLEKTTFNSPTKVFKASDAVLSDGAVLNENCIDNISNLGGKAEFTVNAEKPGVYCITFTYSNNDENGVHDYNVDLVERYVTVTVNGIPQDVYCRNTYSWQTFKTVSCYVELTQGENTISLTNSGNRTFNNNATFVPVISQITVSTIAA
ncbi:MAG: carbohydrate-binding protein [Ruminococcaceae bacterium]|nr:carbohydrate-binding protein [Oscillospiraceae bacterium]